RLLLLLRRGGGVAALEVEDRLAPDRAHLRVLGGGEDLAGEVPRLAVALEGVLQERLLGILQLRVLRRGGRQLRRQQQLHPEGAVAGEGERGPGRREHPR